MLSRIKINSLEEEIKTKLAKSIWTATDGVSVIAGKKACCVCDTQLDHRNSNTISLKALSKKKWFTPSLSSNVPIRFFEEEYCMPSSVSKMLSASELKLLAKVIISPRTYFERENHTSLITHQSKITHHSSTKNHTSNTSIILSICHQCEQSKSKPKLSIVNVPIGTQPNILRSLNDVELALISRGRVSGHIFEMFGGAHKSIRTWHKVYANNVSHTVGSLNLLQAANVKPLIYCVLSGPFTSHQKQFARRSIEIDTRKVIEAFKWLKENNIHYKDLPVPRADELPNPVIVDQSDEVPSVDSNIESRNETTVFFPELGNTDEPGNSEELLQQALLSSRSERITLNSQPTKELLKMWEPEEFVKAFPRQFPFGLGCRPKKMGIDEYIKHLVTLSINEFQRADFILIAANQHFKHAIIRNSSMKCKYMSGDKTAVERFNGIHADEIENILENPSQIDDEPDSNLSYFLRSVFAVSRCLPFSDQAAKYERLKVFSLCTKYGLPTGLLTVTPDDSDNFKMYVYKKEVVDSVSRMHFADCESIRKYLSECEAIRLDYPGFAEFEFGSVKDIVITEVFGWNRETGSPKVEGGVFGRRLKAWFLGVEEQGRKTLHGHFLIWAEGWDEMIRSVHNQNVNSERDVAKMTSFMEANVSTSCFDIIVVTRVSNRLRQYSTTADIGLYHDCIVDGDTSSPASYEYCTDQQLRNMRFHHCPNSTDHLQLARCLKCQRQFTLEDITTTSLRRVLSKNMNLEVSENDEQVMLRYIISICQSGVPNLEAAIDSLPKGLRRFLLHLKRNVHKQRHAPACFKAGCECRARLPTKALDRAQCDFLENQPCVWYTWNGTKQERKPFRLTPKRSQLDVFTNAYHPFISEVFNCNTNFQCAIDGPGIMYVTPYTCKSTRIDDKIDQLGVLLCLKRVLDKELRDRGSLNDTSEDPDRVAFKRLMVAALAESSNYTVSAPMAKQLILNGSRFDCSHSFSHLPIHDLRNGKTSFAKLDVSLKNTMFLSSRRDTYLFRPGHLETVDPYTFYSKFQVRTARGNIMDSNEYFEFQDNAPTGYANLRLVEVDTPTIPTINYPLFASAGALMQDILDADIATNALVEEHCKKILLIFFHYRSEEEILTATTYKASLIENQAKMNPDFEIYMQNIQDCRNSLDSRRIPDILEETTAELPEPADTKQKRKRKLPTAEILAHIDNDLSTVLTDIHDTYFQVEGKDTSNFALSALISHGANDLYAAEGLKPAPVLTPDCSLFKETTGSSEDDSRKRKAEESSKKQTVTRQALIAVQQQRVFRETLLSDSDLHTVSNVVATGSCKSILAWSKAAFGNDEDQKAAFQSLISDFVLQYVLEAKTIDDVSEVDSRSLRRWKIGLDAMRGLQGNDLKQRVIMFLTGPGGSGKSHVIHNIIEYAKQFTALIKQPFTRKTIVVTALTGVAATSILGETLHSAAYISVKGIVPAKLTGDQRHGTIAKWDETKMIIIDEISFAGKNIVESLAKNLEALKKNRSSKYHYGGITVCFAGDFSQLEPVNAKSLYKGDPIDEWHHWVNSFVELRGGHRFRDDAYRELLTQLRSSGVLRAHHHEMLKSRVVNTSNLSKIPAGTQIACGDNKDRCAMNNLAFSEHLKSTHSKSGNGKSHTMIVKMCDMTWKSNKKGMSDNAKHTVFEKVGDYKVLRGKDEKFMDPFLKLYLGAPIMLTENEDVENGIANGTTATVKQIILTKGGEDKIQVITVDGYKVKSIDAKFVERIAVVIKVANKKDVEISLKPIKTQAHIEMPFECVLGTIQMSNAKISATQLTFLMNHATTVHKLQGRSVDELYIANWSYRQNWVYVALSRVRTLAGLYLRTPLDENSNLRPFSQMLTMLQYFRDTKRLRFRTDDYDYS